MRKRKPDEDSVVELTKAYDLRVRELVSLAIHPVVHDLDEHRRQVEVATVRTVDRLVVANRQFAESMDSAALDAARRCDAVAAAKGIILPASPETNEDGFASSQSRYAFVELNRGLANAAEDIRSQVAAAIGKVGARGSIGNYEIAIEETMRESGIAQMRYEDGRHMPIESYAKMLARSSRMETANATAFKRAAELGTDIVKVIGNTPTCEICAQFRDRWYSVSGRDSRFPALYGTVLARGYDVIHPNCRCEFVPVFEEYEGADAVAKAMEYSNRPFEDTRGVKERNAYAAWQNLNRQLQDEQREYKQMLDAMGKEAPYKTLGAYRRARRADNVTDNLKRVIHRKRDTAQFERWSEFVGSEHMPRDLDSFQVIKYTDAKKFEKLQRSRDTLRKVLTKPDSGEYKAKKVASYWRFNDRGVEMTDHSLNRVLGQKHGAGKAEFTEEDVLKALKQPANYEQEDGRQVHYYDNLAVIKNPETGEVVSVISRDTENKKWKHI